MIWIIATVMAWALLVVMAVRYLLGIVSRRNHEQEKFEERY